MDIASAPAQPLPYLRTYLLTYLLTQVDIASDPAQPLGGLPIPADGRHPHTPRKPSLVLGPPPRAGHRVVTMSTLRGRPTTLYSRPARAAPSLPSSGSPRISPPEDAISTSSDASSEQPSQRPLRHKVLALPAAYLPPTCRLPAVFSSPAPILPNVLLDPTNQTKPRELINSRCNSTVLASSASRVDELTSRLDSLSSMGTSGARQAPPMLYGHPTGAHARQAPPMLYGLPAVRRAPTILPPLQKRIHLPCGQPTSHRQPPTTYLRASIPSATPPRRDAHGGYPGSA